MCKVRILTKTNNRRDGHIHDKKDRFPGLGRENGNVIISFRKATERQHPIPHLGRVRQA